jgi:hypothetical protein
MPGELDPLEEELDPLEVSSLVVLVDESPLPEELDSALALLTSAWRLALATRAGSCPDASCT